MKPWTGALDCEVRAEDALVDRRSSRAIGRSRNSGTPRVFGVRADRVDHKVQSALLILPDDRLQVDQGRRSVGYGSDLGNRSRVGDDAVSGNPNNLMGSGVVWGTSGPEDGFGVIWGTGIVWGTSNPFSEALAIRGDRQPW
jgi:hypothetical protein